VANDDFDRRTILTFAFGGPAAVTLAAGMFGVAVDDAMAAQSTARPPGRTIRRVVTAHNADGRSYIAIDEQVPIGNAWETQPGVPLGAVQAAEKPLVTRATGETRFFLAYIPPSTDPKPTLENRVGFHRTAGIAYCYILNGEIVFLADTQEVRLKAGDLLVERNTMHSWRNEGTEPVGMAITRVNAV
jgi:hypothetical protein